MDIERQCSTVSWFRTSGGRRYGLELSMVIAAKLIALTILYFAFIAPQPRANTSSAATRQHVLGQSSATESNPP